ncbi:OmpH family outer membrane protein [Niveispirillum sp. KHB5.9]|uniref:OmpH family outer membrane protein n=1 Tax=Niveispirillum sp. KHB5.9 TaxID=3400269 RepID=UPI003A8629EF
MAHRLTALFLTGLALVAGPVASYAQEIMGQPQQVQQPVRRLPYAQVAVVDIPTILQQATSMRTIQQQLDVQKEQLQRDVAQQQEALRGAEQELARLRQTVSVEEFDRKRTEFETQVSATGRALQERTRRLDIAFNQARNSVINTLDQVIAEVAKETGATLVISRQFIVYQAGGAGDITAEVLERLNSRLPQVPVTVPPPTQ